MSFGERLKYLRERDKVYQSELANKLNLAPSTISMYERGDRDPDTSTLAKIAEIFNVTTDYLLGRTNEPNTVKEIDRKLKEHNIHIAASSKLDLGKLAKLDDKQAKIINNLIDDFLEDEE